MIGLKEALENIRIPAKTICHRCGNSSSTSAYVQTEFGWECIECSPLIEDPDKLLELKRNLVEPDTLIKEHKIS